MNLCGNEACEFFSEAYTSNCRSFNVIGVASCSKYVKPGDESENDPESFIHPETLHARTCRCDECETYRSKVGDALRDAREKINNIPDIRAEGPHMREWLDQAHADVCSEFGLDPTEVRSEEKDPDGIQQHEPGAKLDDGKLLAGLLQQWSRALTEVLKVSTFGAKKYSRGGWQHVKNGPERYTDAMFRHLLLEPVEDLDPDSGLMHEAHTAWNALSRLELMLREKESN